MYQFNPYMGYQQPVQMNQQAQQIVKVNGQESARMYAMQPSSSALLLDENRPIVYLVQTDGPGYKTVSPYEIKPYEPEPTVDVITLEQRIKRLEDMLNESYFTSNEPTKRQTNKQSQSSVRTLPE